MNQPEPVAGGPVIDAQNLLDLEALAREKMSAMAFDYFASGAWDEITLRENRAAFDRIKLACRVMRDVREVDLSGTILGQAVALPVLAAPMAFQRLAHPDGELAMVRAASAAGTAMGLSTLATTAVEDTVAAAKGPVWFQLYVYKDRGVTAELVKRAEAAGCRALALTVDAPVLGSRERDAGNRFHLPDGMTIENMLPKGYRVMPEQERGSGLAAYFASMLDPSLSWRDLVWLRELTELPILVKGVIRPDDAVRAAELGAAGVIVSNHGGRQLDTAPATIEALPAVAAALHQWRDQSGRDVALYMDGGVRRGTDVVKALALGARAVLLGRPLLWGLALAGEAGAAWVWSTLRRELITAMALCGCRNLSEITPDLIWSPSSEF